MEERTRYWVGAYGTHVSEEVWEFVQLRGNTIKSFAL